MPPSLFVQFAENGLLVLFEAGFWNKIFLEKGTRPLQRHKRTRRHTKESKARGEVMENFVKEVKKISTADIMLILEDQIELYTEEEIKILKDELDSRPANALEIEEKEQERMEEIRLKEEEQRKEIERQKRNMENLNKLGLDGYYEYKVISLLDESGFFSKNPGKVDTYTMAEKLNELGIEGWRLVTAYSNELGKNALGGGAGGAAFGINSTIDENILIFERFVKINKG